MIQIENLNFSYKSSDVNVSIFKDFSLSIEKGDFVAIKGPSGSGKSTLLYLIAGLLNFDQGKIQFNGADISKMSDYELAKFRNKKISFIFQQFHLLPKSTVLENILLPTLYPIEEKKCLKNNVSRVKTIISDLGLIDRINHLPTQLSGGQQQRVAIGRALINDPDVILADEPTGNLDSKSAMHIVSILKKLNDAGKSIILITHDDEVASAASKIFHLKDGKLDGHFKPSIGEPNRLLKKLDKAKVKRLSPFNYIKLVPVIMKNAFQHKTRSVLTMLGITVGVAAVCSMITLGNFMKEKILDGYADLGVNTIVFHGYPNRKLKAIDKFPVKYRFFNWEKELLPLKRIFSSIDLISPNLTSWGTTVTFGGKSIEKEPRLIGVSEDGLKVLNRRLIAGRPITKFHIERKHSVCIIGFDIGNILFSTTSPIGQVIHISQNSSTFTCKIIGVLESKTSNKEWAKPNLQIYIPFTVFQAISEYWWSAQIKNVTIKLKNDADVELVGKGIRRFFEKKYGKSGEFRVDSDSILVAQMKKFLSLFSLLLTAIAVITLAVGGIGIANMMLVSVSERLKEIGIRKSVGATSTSIRYQFLLESIFLCTIAGMFGIIIGVCTYQLAILGASKFIDKLEFTWIVDWSAMFFSVVSILLVGVISGLIPALKAEKLQVVDALRSE